MPILAFTAPAVKILPENTYLLNVTIADPCDADIWSIQNISDISYTIGAPTLTQTNNYTNSLSLSFCNFDVVQV